METFLFVLTLISVLAAFTCIIIIASSLSHRVRELNLDLLDCASRGRSMRYDINLLMSSKQDKLISTKRKKGRPRKNKTGDDFDVDKVIPKVIHQLHGKQ